MSNGVVLWRGPSQLDASPLVVIAIGTESDSSNSKTGAMLQTYILRDDMDPVAAVRTGADSSICGQCPHRGVTKEIKEILARLEPIVAIPQQIEPPSVMEGRTCYVNIGQGPSSVFRAYRRGIYPLELDTASVGRGRMVRLGTYGDPAAVPFHVWARLVAEAEGNTGYTHQWRTCDQRLRTLCMASADSLQDAQDAQAKGWRTFRVAMPLEPGKLSGEMRCPASAEMGHRTTCFDCRACSGFDPSKPHWRNVVIYAHGGFAVMRHVNRNGIRPYFARSA